MAERIMERTSKDMYIEDMVKYSIIVDRRRAFPETRDGLKPVQRRTLYSMLNLGAINRTIKCSQITGDTIGKYSPHGPSSVYAAMVVLRNWWKTKVPLITGTGNFGTLMGDGPAAERYTEARLSDFCYDCIISDIKEAKYSVDWKDNYNRSTQEPEFLPVKVPILLINGAFGIGVGLSTSIPSHNLHEVIEVTRLLIKNPKAKFCLIPDHCQPLYLFDTDWQKINDTGYGSYKVRGIVEVTEEKGFPTITVKSLPDDTTTDSVKDKLYNLIEKKQLPMVKDIVDPSKTTVNLKVILKKGSDPNYVIETLYNKCGVQATKTVNFEAVDDINPKRMNYREYLLDFIQFRATTKFRIYCNKYKTVSTRMHRLEVYIRAIESGEIDNIINMVKKQNTIDEVALQEYLIKKLNITDIQAEYILSTDIRKLSKGYLSKYKAEYKELSIKHDVYKRAITDDGTIIMNEIDAELAEIDRKYKSPRLCQVIAASEEKNVPKGTFKIIVTEKNFIRKIPDSERINVVRGDQPKFIIRAENTENILLFDNKGKVFKLPVHKIPVTDKSTSGTDVRILSKNLTADIISVYYEPALKHIVEVGKKHYVCVVTRKNIIKKLDMEDFLNVNLSGLMYTKLRDDDEVVGIVVAPADLDIVIYSNQKALRTHLSDIPLFKRNASGSKAMNTNEDIEGISVVYPDTQYIVVLTTNGKANNFSITGLAAHGRAKAGNNVIKLDPGDSIFTMYGACDSDKLRVVTTDGVVEIPVSEIKVKSGVAVGQKVLPTKTQIIRCDLIYNV